MKTTPHTELDAVNMILRTDGEAPVASLAETGFDEAADAVEALRDVSLAVQIDGWAFNVDRSRQFTPNIDNEIPLPTDTLWVRPAYTSAGLRIVERDRRLYDLDRNSFTFTTPVFLDVCHMLDFESLPAAARFYIAVRASREYQAESTGSATQNSFTETDEMRAEASFKRADNRALPRGFFRQARNARKLSRRPL